MAKATGPTYVVPFRRRKQNITDYKARINMLKSGLPRLVVRKSNKQVICEVMTVSSKGDIVLGYANSKELTSVGWLPRCNTPTAYLTALLLAKKVNGKTKKVILDIGRYNASKNSLVFACAKAFNDAGIECPYDTTIINEDRISGKHIEDYAKMLSDAEIKKKFSEYIKAGIDVRNLTKVFENIKKKLL